MKADFQKQMYDEVKRLFPDGAVETLVARASASGGQVHSINPTVRLVHTATGIEVTCGDFPSQIENYIAATIRLRIVCDHKSDV